MRAGRLRYSIELMRDTVTRDSYGSEIRTPSVYATVPAEDVDLSITERFSMDRTFATTARRFRIRYRSDVLPSDKVRFESQTYAIGALLPYQKKGTLDITCALDTGAS